jgi:histidyl-tRNA synthetase
MQAVVDGALPGIKSQFKRADASGARYALIFGSDEMAEGVVTAKALRGASVAQIRHPLDSVDQWAHSLQSAA